MHRALRAVLLPCGVCAALCGAAAAEDPPPDGPSPEWKWSAFVSDVFDDGRTIGIRRRVGKAGALFLGGSYDREVRTLDGPDVTRSRLGIAGGYRRLLGGGRLKALLEVEARYSLDRIDADSPVSGNLGGEGGGAFTGFEYFFSRSLSLGARVGVDFERRDDPGGGETRRLTLLRPTLVLSGYW